MTETVEQAAERFVGICRLERKVPLPKETVEEINHELTIPAGCIELSTEEQENTFAEAWLSIMKCTKTSRAGITYLQNQSD